MEVIVDRSAQVDILEAYVWYEDQEPGLGKALVAEFDAIVERIGEIPTSYPVVYRLIRRAKLRRYPYLVYFQIRGDKVVIFACVHAKRSARTWRSRLN